MNLQATFVIEKYIELNIPPKDHRRQLQYATAELYDWYMRRLSSIRHVQSEHESAMTQQVCVERDTENGKRLR